MVVEGWIVWFVYNLLYWMYLIGVYGWWKGSVMIVFGYVNVIVWLWLKLY